MPSKTPKTTLNPKDFASLYDGFDASVSRFDCGRKCAPLNGGEPVCCSTQNAVPVVHKVEFELLKARTDLWTKFKPYDYATRQIVEERREPSRVLLGVADAAGEQAVPGEQVRGGAVGVDDERDGARGVQIGRASCRERV